MRHLRVLSTLFFALVDCLPAQGLFPPAGSVFREYSLALGGEKDWRVVEPEVMTDEGRKFLPNSILTFAGVDLTHAVRAELVIDFWSGHPGTLNPRIRFNGKAWHPVPYALKGIDHPESVAEYCGETNLVIPVPLEELRSGENRLQGTCDTNPWGWGQWGWYVALLRIHLDPGKVPALDAHVVPPADGTLGTEVQLQVNVSTPEALREVRYFARHLGVDENGDGEFSGWHGMLRELPGKRVGYEGHAGTATRAPWSVAWDTSWIPDQPDGSLALSAQVRDERGVWTVLPSVEGLSLRRPHVVRMYPPRPVDRWFWVRDGGVKSAVVPVPLWHAPARASAARMHLRTWNAENNEVGHTPVRLNQGSWLSHLTGPGHQFHQEAYPIDPASLQAGHNLVTFTSTTKHHGCELMWPGPVLLVRYDDPSLAPATDPVQAPSH